jgi:hypothetical protein
MKSQGRIKLKRVTEPMRARKAASMTNSINQPNLKMNNNKRKEQSNETQPGKKSNGNTESNKHLPIITPNVSGLNFLMKRH